MTITSIEWQFIKGFVAAPMPIFWAAASIVRSLFLKMQLFSSLTVMLFVCVMSNVINFCNHPKDGARQNLSSVNEEFFANCKTIDKKHEIRIKTTCKIMSSHHLWGVHQCIYTPRDVPSSHKVIKEYYAGFAGCHFLDSFLYFWHFIWP